MFITTSFIMAYCIAYFYLGKSLLLTSFIKDDMLRGFYCGAKIKELSLCITMSGISIFVAFILFILSKVR